MPALQLLTLDLRSPLPYEGLENPPLAGAPLEGMVLIPSAGGSAVEAAVGMGLAEGEEEVFLFDEASLVDYDPDEGPRIGRPLPAPGYYGRGATGGRESRATSGKAASSMLPRGRYAFAQWRPRDEEELAEGLEWFARELWWERSPTEGPFIVRRVREDGALATQALRRLKQQLA
jgi:hypothetical protein